MPFIRYNYTNTFYDHYYLPRSPEDATQLREMHQLEMQLIAFDKTHTDANTVTSQDTETYRRVLVRFLELEGICARRYAKNYRSRPEDLRSNPNRRQWLPNNHFVNQAVYLDNPNVHHFRYLFTILVQHRNIPDAEFVLHLRDYPVLNASYNTRTDNTTVLNPFPDLETDATPTVLDTLKGGMAPVLSHTGKDGYADIPLPTCDDVEHYSQRLFQDKCDGKYIDVPPYTPTPAKPDAHWVEWKDKTIAKAVFRGSGTGRGVTVNDNQRLAVWQLAHTDPYRDVLDVELTSLNVKPKMTAGCEGLQHINVGALQHACGSVAGKQHRLSLAQRSQYKYVLCLDGHTRADRMCNEMRTGSLLILPTPPPPHGGHRLWIEAFLTPLNWERDIRDTKQELTVASVRKGHFTHVTVDDVLQLGHLVQWLVAHDTITVQVVANMKNTMFDPKHGLFARKPPETSFLYDYVEGVVRVLAENHACNASKPYTLIPAPTSKVRQSPVVGIVVGFRDSSKNGVRTAQLRAFCEYFHTLFPASWKRVIVVAEQAIIDKDVVAFGKWWVKHIGSLTATITVADFQATIGVSLSDNSTSLPECVVRNLKLVNNDIDLALGVPDKYKRSKHLAYVRQKWTREEAYRRIGEQKFNLGLLKNAGYVYLKRKYGKQLSHIVFTDIDMLPDHELAPWYARLPVSNEIIALSHRGTVYDVIRTDNLPVYTLATEQDDRSTHRAPKRSKRQRGGRKKTFRGQRFPKRWSQQRQPVYPFPTNVTQQRRSTPGPRIEQHARKLANEWIKRKFTRFLGAAMSIHPALFERVNGYPNSFAGWGGEDDAVVQRLELACGNKPDSLVYTVPTHGRLIDLEMAQPVTFEGKLGARVKEMQKRELLKAMPQTWKQDGVAQVEQCVAGGVDGTQDKEMCGTVVRVKISILNK